MLRGLFRRILLPCAGAALFGSVAWAVITGSITGVITDPSGAVIAGVAVVATNQATGVQTSAMSNAKGFYTFPALGVGEYTLTYSHQGFEDRHETSVKIDVDTALRIDAQMVVGSVATSVEVQSEVLQVDTQSSQGGLVIESAQMEAMPLNGRSYLQLLTLQPGVSPITSYSSTNGQTASPGGGSVSGSLNPGTQSVDGGRPGANGFMVNGADAQEAVQSVAAIIPNLDSIQEFRVITNNFDAQYGNFSGGQINVVTKSGTNSFHGDAFEFIRNTDTDAKNYYLPSRSPFKQNQFGGIVGGPIRKDKFFFFGDYQGTRQSIAPQSPQVLPLPSSADRMGNLLDQAPQNGGPFGVGKTLVSNPGPNPWAQVLGNRLGYNVYKGEPYYTPTCTSTNWDPVSQPTTGCIFPNAVIPQAAFDPVAVNTLKYFPAGSTYVDSLPLTLSDDKFGIRGDGKIRYGNLFVYFFRDRYNQTNPYGTSLPGFSTAYLGTTEMANVGLTSTLGSYAVNDLRLVYLRARLLGNKGIGGEGVSLASLGFNTNTATGGIVPVDPSQEAVPIFAFNNNVAFGSSTGAQFQTNNTYQIIDNVLKTIGLHNIQVGADLHFDQVQNLYAAGINTGFIAFSGNETGVDFADYLIGAPDADYLSGASRLDERNRYLGFYLQDSWHALPTLTLNYGLRWEYESPWWDTQNKVLTYLAGEQSETFPSAPVGVVAPGDPGIPRTLSKIQHGSFAPRFGLVYAPAVSDGLLGKVLGGPGKFSVRAGYGIAYQSLAGLQLFTTGGGPPYTPNYGGANPPILNSPFIDRATGVTHTGIFPGPTPPRNASPSNPYTTFDWANYGLISGRAYDTHNVLPYTQEYEFGIQRALGSRTVLNLSYVGTISRHQITLQEGNPVNQALCLQLNNPANVALNSPTCSPFNENQTFTTASGQVIDNIRSPLGSTSFSSITYLASTAMANYNSFQASIQHTSRYATFLVSYTKAKALATSSDDFDNTNPINPSLSYGLSLANVPNDLTASYTFQLPFQQFIGKGEGWSRLSAGWSLSGISIFASGAPVRMLEKDDHSLVGANGTNIDEPIFANNGTHLFQDKNPRHGNPYFNPNYFAAEPLGQFGNVSPAYFSGPGTLNTDLALIKDTKIHEAMSLQLRAEAFNVFNHAQFGGPDGTFTDSQFGYVTSAAAPRLMQGGVKFVF
jgi:hypothetical protein